MKQIFKQSLVFVLALVLILMTGCSGKKNSVKISDDEPLSITMLFGENPAYPYNKDWAVLKEIEKIKNVKFDIQAVSISDIGDKRKILFNSGNLPDLIGFTWSNDVSEYIDSGIILPINQYEDKLPNMMQKIKELDFADGVNNLRELDGNYYVLPQMNETKSQSLCMFLRKDVFEKNNIEIPTTYDELYSSMKKLKEIYPDSLPFTNYGKQQQFFASLGPAFGSKGMGHPYGYAYDKEDDIWEFVPTTEEYKNMMEYTVKLSNEGLLDPESFTQDRNQWAQKLVSGKSFVTYGYFGSTDQINQDGRKLHGDDFEFVEVLPLAGPDGKIGVAPSSRGGGSSIAIAAAKANDPNFDRFMEFVDWLYFSDEGVKLTRLGVEGLTYQMTNGGYECTPNIKTALNPAGTQSLTKDFGVSEPNLSIVNMKRFNTKATDPKSTEYQNTLRENNWIPDTNPTLLIKNEDKEELNILVQKLANYTNQSIFDFVITNKSLKDWDTYISDAESIGYKKLEEIVNKNWKENRKK